MTKPAPEPCLFLRLATLKSVDHVGLHRPVLLPHGDRLPAQTTASARPAPKLPAIPAFPPMLVPKRVVAGWKGDGGTRWIGRDRGAVGLKSVVEERLQASKRSVSKGNGGF